MYEVIHTFTDLQDFDHLYNVGDLFPRVGAAASEERIKELSGSNNKQGKPLIRKIREIEKQKEAGTVDEQMPFSDADITLETQSGKQYTRTDIQRMNKAELLDMGKSCGIDGVDEMTGAELKERILGALNL